MTSTPEVESLLADHPDAVAGIARLLRRTLLDGHPPLVERVRRGWHSINFHDPGAGFVCAVFPLVDRVQLVFERGAQLPDPDGLLTGTGRQVRALEFTDEADVDPETVLEFLDHALDVGSQGAQPLTARRATGSAVRGQGAIEPPGLGPAPG